MPMSVRVVPNAPFFIVQGMRDCEFFIVKMGTIVDPTCKVLSETTRKEDAAWVAGCLNQQAFEGKPPVL